MRDHERSERRSRSRSRNARRNSVSRKSQQSSRSPSPKRSPSERRSRSRSRNARRSRERDDNKTRKVTSKHARDDDDDRREKHRRATSKRRRSRSRSRSVSSASSSDDSSSASSSSSDDDSRRKRKHKKRTSSTSKKHAKRSKKTKKRDKKKKKKDATHAVNQNEYGTYGIIRESDFHAKSVSFQAWLRDIKKISDFNGPKWEAMELFKEYMEDYNTATMPHEKYYDIERYELRARQKSQRRASRKGAATPELEAAADEQRVRLERQQARAKRERDDFKLILQHMDPNKIEDMRKQEELKAQMRMFYKAGNVTEARRLEQLINKVDDVKVKR